MRQPSIERAPVPADLASRLAVPAASLTAVLHGLGMRLAPPGVLGAGQYGPPAPPMMLPRRHVRPPAARPAPPVRPDNPFAALAVLRR